GARLDLVLVVLVGELLPGADSPAIIAPVALVPPAVEYAEVEPAVDADFHATGPARLQRPAGGVQPNVYSLDQVPGQVHVVVLEENDAASKLGPAGVLDQLGDQLLAPLVLRVRLTGEHKLNRPVLVVQDCVQSLEVAEDERAALVGGEAAGE